MTRAAAAAAAVALVLLCVEAAAGVSVMPSYMAAWIFCLAVPAGALPLVMVAELAGADTPVVAGLRRLLLLMPAAALSAMPILLTLPAIYPWAHGDVSAGWYGNTAFCVRIAVSLLLWCGLVLLFISPPARSRRPLCLAGLMIHAVLATLVATDAVLSLNAPMSAAGFGVLLMTAQCGTALSAALLLAPAADAGSLLLLAMAAWGFAHFSQYLVIWSANKPDEITWYLQRENPLGEAAVWLGVAAFLPVAVLAWRRTSAPVLLTPAAALVLFAHAVEAYWLVTPSIRGHFTINIADVAAFAGLALLGAAAVSVRWRLPRTAAP